MRQHPVVQTYTKKGNHSKGVVMNQLFKKFLSLALLISSSALLAKNCCNNSCNTSTSNTSVNSVVTQLIPRSTSFNNVIKDACEDPYNEFFFMDECWGGHFDIALEYSQTFRNSKLAECYFGPAAINGCNTNSTTVNNSCNNSCDDCDNSGVQIRVAGTAAPTPANGTTDLVAQNFFLPADFSSVLTFSPSIKDVNVHFQFYAQWTSECRWMNDWWVRVYAPVTNARWDMDVCENITSAGTLAAGSYAAGLISPAVVPNTSLFQSFSSFASGNALTSTIPGVTVQPLQFAKLSCGTETITRLADLRAELGWNFVNCDEHHFGLYLEAAAPTGNKPCPEFLFAPVAGNGHFWEFGGGLTAHRTLWSCEDAERQFDFYLDANVTHLFKRNSLRTFDLKNKPLSRYMIAEKLTTTPVGLTVASGTTFVAPNAQFAGVYAPVANFTTLDVDISIPVQGEVMAKFVYSCEGFSWELGYDFYGRSCENVSYDACNDNNNCNTSCTTSCNSSCNDSCDNMPFQANTWALRGDAQVYGFNTSVTPIAAVALGATRNAATAFSLSGCGTANVVTTPDVVNNTQIDNQAVAFTTAGAVALRATPSATDTGNINTSNPAVFIALTDIDFSGTRLISNKVFTNFNYTWKECNCVQPYLGIGASVEFGSTSSNDCCNTNTCPPTTTTTTTLANCCNDNDDCGSCITCTPSQWAIWLKGGLSWH